MPQEELLEQGRKEGNKIFYENLQVLLVARVSMSVPI